MGPHDSVEPVVPAPESDPNNTDSPLGQRQVQSGQNAIQVAGKQPKSPVRGFVPTPPKDSQATWCRKGHSYWDSWQLLR